MPQSTPAVSDHDLTVVLGAYAGMVEQVMADPQRWLGVAEPLGADVSLPRRALGFLRRRAFGQLTPASPTWSSRPLRKRVGWWVRRISLTAGVAAAVPRFAGALADRIPLQSALGASAAGLAVCATAREYGVVDAAHWVPLLSEVLLRRHLEVVDPSALPASAASARELQHQDDGTAAPGRRGRWSRGTKTAVSTLWQLTRKFLELDHLLDARPRGGIVPRIVAQLPVVGVAGGFLDERGGIRRAAKQTRQLLDAERRG